MEIKVSADVSRRLRDELVVWLTTVRANGTPMPTPVWFLWQDDSFLIYTIPGSRKLHNISRNPRASLNLNSDFEGGEVVVLMGKIAQDHSAPPADQNDAFLEKYREQIDVIRMTPESFAKGYSVALRFIPEYVRA